MEDFWRRVRVRGREGEEVEWSRKAARRAGRLWRIIGWKIFLNFVIFCPVAGSIFRLVSGFVNSTSISRIPKGLI